MAAGAAGPLPSEPARGDEAKAENADAHPGAILWSRKVPQRYEADVAVIGGGIAAALSAQEHCDPRALDPKDARRLIEQRGASLAV